MKKILFPIFIVTLLIFLPTSANAEPGFNTVPVSGDWTVDTTIDDSLIEATGAREIVEASSDDEAANDMSIDETFPWC